jgi:hypothetical protein
MADQRRPQNPGNLLRTVKRRHVPVTPAASIVPATSPMIVSGPSQPAAKVGRRVAGREAMIAKPVTPRAEMTNISPVTLPIERKKAPAAKEGGRRI